MNIFINYADNNFKNKQRFSSIMAKVVGGFDKVIEYSPADIDSAYYDKHAEILKCERGGGYWLWKSYFINKTLESMNDGDYLFYCDAGAYFIRSVHHIINDMSFYSEDIAVFQLPLTESDYTNSYTRIYFGYHKSMGENQVLGTYICIKKTPYSVAVFKGYQKFCEDKMLITDVNTLDTEQHRHDQSILSLHTKTLNIKPFRDPSDYGEFPDKYYRNGFSFNNEHVRGNYPTIILSNRKVNPLVYLVRYIAKKILKWI